MEVPMAIAAARQNLREKLGGFALCEGGFCLFWRAKRK
jgi:hypothetical protein